MSRTRIHMMLEILLLCIAVEELALSDTHNKYMEGHVLAKGFVHVYAYVCSDLFSLCFSIGSFEMSCHCAQAFRIRYILQ